MHDAVKQIVERFKLIPHPEGGYYREVYRSPLEIQHPGVDARHDPSRRGSTFIYFLLGATDFSAFHRVRWSDEVWHLYAGGPLELHTIDAQHRYAQHVLTGDLERGEPAHVVPAGCWQATRLAPGAKWAFCGCTVAPGFDFADFELAEGPELAARHPAHATRIARMSRPR
jgi:predicted cupin superfamily sugar epimerase